MYASWSTWESCNIPYLIREKKTCFDSRPKFSELCEYLNFLPKPLLFISGNNEFDKHFRLILFHQVRSFQLISLPILNRPPVFLFLNIVWLTPYGDLFFFRFEKFSDGPSLTSDIFRFYVWYNVSPFWLYIFFSYVLLFILSVQLVWFYRRR